MAYLEDVIAATQKSKARTKQSQGTASLITALIAQKRAQEELAASQAMQTRPSLVAARPVAARSGGSSGPHSTSDSHNHGGGNQSVSEANELWRRLQNMIKDAPGKITPGPRTRDYATQVALWNKYKAGKGAMAAKPGTSKHGNGRANDLKYQDDNVRNWALQNAGKYGLAFPIYNPKLGQGRDESWHVELKR